MNSRSKNLLAAGLAATLTVSGPAADVVNQQTSLPAPAKVEQPQLQLVVDVPPNWRPFLADDLAEAFASRVSDVFRRRGYTGDVKFLDHGDPNPQTPLLAIRLIHWRIGRTDNAECTFTATLTTGGRDHDLGVFEDTTLFWNKSMGRWGLATALGDVADAALRDLAIKLTKTELLPGFPPPKK